MASTTTSTTIDKNLFAQMGETPEAYIQRTQAYKASLATVPSTTSTTPIPAGDLGATTPLKVAPLSPPTAGGGLEQFITASTDGIDLQQQEAVKEAQKASKESQGAYATILKQFGMQPQRNEEIYQQEGVDQKRKAVDNYTQQIRAEQLANRRQVEELRAVGGQNRSSFNDEVAKINRESLSKQADLAILQNAAVDNYNTAAAIADRKIQYETETLKAEADYFRFFYEENKADFTRAEDRYYSTLAQEKQNAYQQAVTEKKTLSDMKLEMLKSAAAQGAPDSVLQAIQGAQTPEAAIASAGPFAGDVLARQIQMAQLTKLRSESVSGGGGVGGGNVSNITQSVIDNPSLFDDLTPTVRGKVIAELQANGYDTSNLGVKGLSDTAIKELAQTQKALSDLDELKAIIQSNEDLIGPVSGLQRFNPYSKARKIQADVDRVRQTVGKALEGGVLRKEDEEKYKKILATLADTPSTALYKVDALIGSIRRDIETYKSLQISGGKSLDVGASLQKSGAVLSEEELRKKYGY